jgi:hypothetical protein
VQSGLAESENDDEFEAEMTEVTAKPSINSSPSKVSVQSRR